VPLPSAPRPRLRAALLVPLLALAGIGIAALDADSGLRTWLGLRQDLAEGRATIARLERGNEALRREIEALESDGFAVERAIREELGWALPGEAVVEFQDTDIPGEAPPAPPAGLPTSRLP